MKNRKGNAAPPMAFRPRISGSLRLDDVLINMPTVPELGEGDSNIGLDMKLVLGPRRYICITAICMISG